MSWWQWALILWVGLSPFAAVFVGHWIRYGGR